MIANAIQSARVRTTSTMIMSSRPLPEPARCNSIQVIDNFSQQGTVKTPSVNVSEYESVNPPFHTPKQINEQQMADYMTIDDMV